MFDENKMNALDKVSSNFPLNHVAVVQKSGYIMHDKVIRHALVSVSNGFNNTIQVMPQVTNNLNHQHNNVHMQQQNNKFYPHNNVVEPTKQFQNFNQGFSQQKNSQHSQIRQNVNNQQMYPTNVISKQVNIPTAVVNTAKNLSNSQNNEKKNK